MLLRACRQELIRHRLEYKDRYFAVLERLARSGSKDPFVLSALAQKAASDGDAAQAIRYATEVIDQGSTSAYDYLLLDQLLARSGRFSDAIPVLRKAAAIAPYNYLIYESLAAREFASGNKAEALEAVRRGLELFPEDSVLREIGRTASQ
jgi:Flp pilus assembly protein TadD